MFFLYQFKPGIHILRLCALDTNYFAWVSAGGFGSGTGTGETTQLSGGLGVFGSGFGDSVEVYVKKDTARVNSKSGVIKWSSIEWTSGRLRDSSLGHWATGSLCLLPLLADSQPFGDRRQQLLTPDRLGDERVGPGFERSLNILLVCAPG
jgi:hypothetical protein